MKTYKEAEKMLEATMSEEKFLKGLNQKAFQTIKILYNPENNLVKLPRLFVQPRGTYTPYLVTKNFENLPEVIQYLYSHGKTKVTVVKGL